MNSPLPSPSPGSLRQRLSNLFGITELKQKVDALETTIKQNAEYTTALEKRFLTVLKNLADSLTTLDKRTASNRAADFLAELSQIHPKKRIVLFMGRSYFGDNIKYAYLSFLPFAQQNDILCYFLPQDATQYTLLKSQYLPCLSPNLLNYKPEELDILLKAKVLVLDEQFITPNWRQFAPHALLQGAKTIQLWHGIPLKRLGFETITSARLEDPATAELYASCGSFDVFVAPSLSSRTDWERKFAFEAFAAIGYPRNDVFFRDMTENDALNVDQETLHKVTATSKDRPSVLYAPTFRDHKDISWFEKTQISVLANYCRSKNYQFYVNLHPGEQSVTEQFRLRYPDVNFIAPFTDIYPILKNISLLITDYSSLAYDFLLLDRPILFYRPDHADYMLRSRQLVEDQETYDKCGIVIQSIEDLVHAFAKSVERMGQPDSDPYRAPRQNLRQKLFDFNDGKAGLRLQKIIIGLLEADS